MDEERALNERIKAFPRQQRASLSQQQLSRSRTVSSPSANLQHELLPTTPTTGAAAAATGTPTDFQRPRLPSTTTTTTTTTLDDHNQME